MEEIIRYILTYAILIGIGVIFLLIEFLLISLLFVLIYLLFFILNPEFADKFSCNVDDYEKYKDNIEKELKGLKWWRLYNWLFFKPDKARIFLDKLNNNVSINDAYTQTKNNII